MSLTALLGCNSGQASAPDPGPTLIEVRDGQTVLVTVRPGKPCRATIGPNEMIVGSDPLVSQLGDAMVGQSTATGTLVQRDGLSGGSSGRRGAAGITIRTASRSGASRSTATRRPSPMPRAASRIRSCAPPPRSRSTRRSSPARGDLVLAALLAAPGVARAAHDGGVRARARREVEGAVMPEIHNVAIIAHGIAQDDACRRPVETSRRSAPEIVAERAMDSNDLGASAASRSCPSAPP
jgi:hypothetical protein